MRNASGQSVVLLTADNAVEALAISEALKEADYRVAGPFGQTADALIWIKNEKLDLAILGAAPTDGSGEVVAAVLHELGIPFLVHSFDPPDGRATGASGVPWLPKPAWPWDVVATLDELSLMTMAQ